jgi:protein O-GlcNAc transferase
MPGVADMLAEGVRHHRAGELLAAEALYRQALRAEPANIDALHLLGLIAQRTDRLELALELIGKAVALNPAFANAQRSLGRALLAHGKRKLAIDHFQRAVALAPDFVEARIDLGYALVAERQIAEAVTQFEQAVALRPQSAETHAGHGNALHAAGKLDAAIESYRRALALDPSLVAAQVNLGSVLRDAGRHVEAIECFRRGLTLSPDLAATHNNLANSLRELGRTDEAIASYRRALALREDYAMGHTNLGSALTNLGRHEEALGHHRRAVELDPDLAEAQANYALAIQATGRLAEAAPYHERALALDPNIAKSQLGYCMAQLRVLYNDEAEIDERRAAYAAALTRLVTSDIRDPRGMAEAVGGNLPFYLAYQGRNDCDLQRMHGELACRVTAQFWPPAPMAPPAAPDEPIRVGFVSGFFWLHSVWKMPLKGWMSQLDRKRFRVFGYHTQPRRDAETRFAASQCERFVQGAMPLAHWRERILADRPHVLIYPEIGMDTVTAQLAAQRLAAVQCTSWGHPDTSGFPTIDYYLSSALMEPPDADAHYCERLVRLPNLSIYYEPVAVPAVAIERAALGLRANATVYWCGQSLFKYLPQHDEVFARIAEQAGDCQFVFLEFAREASVTGQFRRRVERAFAARGLDYQKHCLWLPPLPTPRYIAAMGRCDVFLDSVGWSGCNSAFESLEHNLPIVTCAGPLMRGRHSTALLAMMGIAETVAATVDAYVAIAIRLAQEPEFRERMRQAMRANKHRVYRDRAPIAALEEFLERVARKPTR